MVTTSRLPLVLLLASVLAGASYLYPVAEGLSGPEIIVWKGMGVGFLAAYAALRAQSRDGWLLALVLGLGAAGDVVLDLVFTGGAALFALGHIVAIILYRRHVRVDLEKQDRLIAALLIGLPVGLAWALTQRADVTLYTLLLGSMASAAWSSRFPRALTALGAFLFLLSDLLIFARMGPLAGSLTASLGVWSLYYAGQLLIVLGGVRFLNEARVA